MKNRNLNGFYNGFTLIEVMIALVVLSLGLLALGKFQGVLLKSTSDSVARTEAVALAEEKIEDLRSFTMINAPVAYPSWAASNPEMAYGYIATNAGGRLVSVTDFSLQSVASGSGSVNFNRTWTVTDVVINGEQAKQILVTIAWQDQDGNQDIQLTVSTVKPGAAIAISDTGGNDFSPPGIVANLDDGSDRYDTLDTGDGLRKRTSKPLPDVFHTGDYHKVNFDVVTYVNNANPTVVKRESFTTVNCLCTFNGTGSGFTPGYAKFENATQTLNDTVDGFISGKVVGVPANNLQPFDCDMCCRDHHDGGTGDNNDISYVLGHSGTGDHDHYLNDLTASPAPTTGDYWEACRIKVINGNRRVFQDWQLKNIAVISGDYLSDPDETYSDEVTAFVLDTARSGFISSNKPMGDGAISIGEGGNEQLQARAILMDKVYETNTVDPIISYSDFISTSATGHTLTPLLYIPFVEINLTKLSSWRITNEARADDVINADPCSGAAAPTDIICVTSEEIVDEGFSENNYSRGLVKALNENIIVPDRVIAYANPDNTAITGTSAINASFETTSLEALTETAVADTFDITVVAGTSFYSLSGSISFCSGLNGPEKNSVYAALQSAGVAYSGGDSGSCTVNPKSGNSGSYSCSGIAAGLTVQVDFPTEAFPTPASSIDYTTDATNVDFQICDA